jgi:hypothetical protein
MPLIQLLPSTWTNQHVLASASNTNISTGDVIISNSGVKFGTTGKNYIALKMPFCTFYCSNQGTGTAVLVFKRASDNVVLYATAIQPITSTTGDQFRQFTLPVDDVNGLTLESTKSGTTSLTIVASGLTDSGLLPEPDLSSSLPLQASRSQQLQLAGGRALGKQTIGGGVSL